MRILEPKAWQDWCIKHNVHLREAGWLRPDIRSKRYSLVEIPYPKDSGKKVNLARRLLSLVDSGPELLLLVDDWAVWPSSQHMPLFTRFRQALGENRPLIEAPGHLVTPTDHEDAVSIIATSLLFFWDCYGISSSGRDAFYFSHDEYCLFSSRDPAVAAKIAEKYAPKK